MKKVLIILTGLLFLGLVSTSFLSADDKADIERVIKSSLIYVIWLKRSN